MDIKKLTIEIELLRIIKPIANESILALKEIAKRLQEIHKFNELEQDEKWKLFQKETYTDLQKIKEISDKFEERKKKLFQNTPLINKSLELDGKTKIEFDIKANVVKVFKEGSATEII